MCDIGLYRQRFNMLTVSERSKVNNKSVKASLHGTPCKYKCHNVWFILKLVQHVRYIIIYIFYIILLPN